MKKIIPILAMCFIFTLSIYIVNTYTYNNVHYVDADCATPGDGTSDTCAAAGTDPFQTVAAAQAALTGDQSDNSLLFKKGNVWREQFTVGANGTSGHPFTIGAYGTGDAPIISGADVISGNWGYAVASVVIDDDAADDDTADWTLSNCTLTFDTDHYVITQTGTTQYVIQNNSVSVTDNVLHRSTVSLKRGTGISDVKMLLSESWSANNILPNEWVTTTNDWISSSKTGTTTSTTDSFGIVLSLDTGKTMFIKDIKLEELIPNTWETTGITTEPLVVFMDKTLLIRGSDQYTLTDHQWFWTGNILYIRDDSGNPDITGVVIEAGQNDAVINLNGKSHITIDGLQLEGGQRPGLGGTVGGGIFGEDSNNITILNCLIRLHHNHGIVNMGGDDWDIEYNTIRDIDSHNTGIGGDAIAMGSNIPEDPPTNIMIKYNTIEGYIDRQGISFVTGSNIEIGFNTFTSTNHDWAIDIEPNAGWTVDTMNIHNNIMNILTNGVSASAAAESSVCSNITIDENELDLNDAEKTAFRFSNCTGTNIISNNIAVHTNTGITVNSSILEIAGNKIDDGDISGVSYGAFCTTDSEIVVKLNVFIGQYRAIYINNEVNAEVYNNDFIDNEQAGIRNESSGICNFKNNIIYKGDALAQRIIELNNGTASYNNNMYYPDGVSEFYFVDTYYNFANWQTASSQDANSIVADPLFTNAAGGDFSLKNNSPACKGGTYLSGYTTKWKWGQTDPLTLITVEDALSIGAYACPKGSALMGF